MSEWDRMGGVDIGLRYTDIHTQREWEKRRKKRREGGEENVDAFILALQRISHDIASHRTTSCPTFHFSLVGYTFSFAADQFRYHLSGQSPCNPQGDNLKNSS